MGWYQKGGYKSIVFVPPTPGSKLMKIYKGIYDENKLEVRVVETAGTPLKRLLQRSDPHAAKRCGRSMCFVCSTDGKGNCRSTGVTYEITCISCADAGRLSKYVGQTARSAYLRGKEHLSSLQGKREESRAWEHHTRAHPGEEPRFPMSVTGVYRHDTMLRQIAEVVRIRNTYSV